MPFPALLDANVLIPLNTADLLLRLAEADTFCMLWSEQILDEIERNLVSQLGRTPEQAQRRVATMRVVFPDAMVTGYEPLIGAMTNDEKDRHVLAAAVRANADVIVTFNLKDSPSAALAPYDITAVAPDDFLLDQLELYPHRTLDCLYGLVFARQRPPLQLAEFLARFAGVAPRFVAEVHERLRQAEEATKSLMIPPRSPSE
ncbi:putative toxin-antitoxin system toxin component, PIN family [Amycolatopsis sp. NPDC051758]|uniref:putative toxin-antitoxin system toxin component, PIN family n=1 Tax=Amycolatopsis sp. NPDC051758 TaxID=3363935 RepID=UPI0037BB55EE